MKLNFQIVNTYIYENLIVNYKVITIDKKDVLVIQIPATIVDDEVIKYLGNMYQDLKVDFIECPRVSNVDE